jgi:hypothetical protein
MSKKNTFRIGLSMAGAVSAGAYTAGVIDYLLEALENWEKAKSMNLPGVPQHKVVIEVLSGASAGGMTAVITSAAIQKNFPHINQKNFASTTNVENPLFDSWVNLTENPGSDMMSQMLAKDDILTSESINPDNEVRSIFNSLFIEKIARRVLDTIMADQQVKRPYFAHNLDLFTTITNLRGFDYQLEFRTAVGLREDRMKMHKDLVHFQLNTEGTYQNDGKIPFHFSTPEGMNKNLLIDAAIATGAFPVGLAPRVLVRDARYINDNPYLKITHGNDLLVEPSVPYNTVCVDGGVINNEPYDLTEFILADRRRAELQKENQTMEAVDYSPDKSASGFDTTILMIDPFPNYDEVPAQYFELQAVKFAAPQLFSAMRQQLMIKEDLLEKVYSDSDYSRFMIAPIRTKDGITQKDTIACGSLGGFGGFFSRDFRVHDFMLGRRNCQRFIQQYFCVPESEKNEIIETGYGNLEPSFISFFEAEKAKNLPIIPDLRISADQSRIVKPDIEGEFPYPSVSLKYLLSLEAKMQDRLDAVLKNATNGKDPGGTATEKSPTVLRIRKKSWFNRNIVGPCVGAGIRTAVAWGIRTGKSIAAEKFVDAVIIDMEKRGLLNVDC